MLLDPLTHWGLHGFGDIRAFAFLLPTCKSGGKMVIWFRDSKLAADIGARNAADQDLKAGVN